MTNDPSNKKSSFGYGVFPETNEPVKFPAVLPAPSNKSLPSGDEEEIPAKPIPPRSVPGNGPTYSCLGPIGKKGEPLSLAEVLAWERSQGLVEPDYDEAYEKLKQNGDSTYLSELKNMTVTELVAEARQQKNDQLPENVSRQKLIFQIMRRRIKENGLMYGEGTLEILPDQFGFLRSPEYHYISCPDDIYISPSQIRRFGLRKGCIISGQIRPPKENERYFALLRVEAINHEEPYLLNNRPIFENLTPVHPNTRVVLPHDNDVDLKIIDLLIPIGFGQRGLIISPPRCGKTTLIRKLATSVLENYPEVYVFVLLIDERPEEATEMAQYLKGPRSEVICSFFDEDPIRHILVSEIVFEKAKRMVECGKNVFIFLDSLTRLAQADDPDSDMGGDPLAMNLLATKKLFGSARRVESGGSLTVIATALTETENPADEVVYRQFQGTGNLEIRLSRLLAEKRIWPAIDIHKSGTQREEHLLSDAELKQSSELRRTISEMPPETAMDYLRTNE